MRIGRGSKTREVRILAEFFQGFSPFGQFFNQKIRSAGVGIHLGF
ncbi:MAG: DUF1207 domain-containing protein [Vicinamibacteria bacterium]|nr:DUF1207 domain-containing protein [Vicinamibacteria bacterium]